MMANKLQLFVKPGVLCNVKFYKSYTYKAIVSMGRYSLSTKKQSA